MTSNHEPSEDKVASEPLKHLASARNEIEAQLWAGVLADNGIHCLIKRGTALDSFFSILTPVNVPCEIYVLASEADAARQILQDLSEAE